MSHSPTPWKLLFPDSDCLTIIDANNQPVAQLWSKSEEPYDNYKANAARIISCVNEKENIQALLEKSNAISRAEESIIVLFDSLLCKLHKRCLGNEEYEKSELYKEVDAALQLLDTNTINHGTTESNNPERKGD